MQVNFSDLRKKIKQVELDLGACPTASTFTTIENRFRHYATREQLMDFVESLIKKTIPVVDEWRLNNLGSPLIIVFFVAYDHSHVCIGLLASKEGVKRQAQHTDSSHHNALSVLVFLEEDALTYTDKVLSSYTHHTYVHACM